MGLAFYKLNGAGNDFIFLDGIGGSLPQTDLGELARLLCRRGHAVGADGLIALTPAEGFDARMTIWNADGSLARMCGNGIRCAALLLCELGYVSGEDPSILFRTDAGPRRVAVHTKNGRFVSAETDMGVPSFDPDDVPVLNGRADSTVTVIVDREERYPLFCVSMGNPHAVAFVDDPAALDLPSIGPLIENAPVFPDRTNVEFVSLSPDGTQMDFRVWERGCGETKACGTGICAAAAAAVKTGRAESDRPITVRALGGTLEVVYTSAGHVLLRGPAELVYKGEWKPC